MKHILYLRFGFGWCNNSWFSLVWNCSSFCLKFQTKTKKKPSNSLWIDKNDKMIHCRKKSLKLFFRYFCSYKRYLRRAARLILSFSGSSIENTQTKIEVEPKNNFLIYIIAFAQLKNPRRACFFMLLSCGCTFGLLVCFFFLVESFSSSFFRWSLLRQNGENSRIYCGKE